MKMSRIVDSGHQLSSTSAALDVFWGAACTEGALNPVLARRLVVRKGEVGHRGVCVVEDGLGSEHKSKGGGVRAEGGREKEGGVESGCLSSFCCANVTSDC